MVRRRTVVVGAALAGLRTAEALRRAGDDSELTVVGAEPSPPYDRPPLSKQVLTDPARPIAELCALDLPVDLGADWRLGVTATGLDIHRRRVRLSDGGDLSYDQLVIATGATPRRLPPHLGTPDGLHVLRTAEDAAALRGDLARDPRVVVVGAGFIGLEVASSCRTRGLTVTVVEPQAAPVARAAPSVVGRRLAALHRSQGTTLILGTSVAALEGTGRVEGVRLGDGRVVPADVVVVGIGVTPATGWLEDSGVDLDNGVRCDARLRVLAAGRPVPGVVAAGDVACWDWPATGPTRLEHWTNAVEQAEAAAAALHAGEDGRPFAPVPYVWSDQGGVKVQMVGHYQPGDEVALLEEDPERGRWLYVSGRNGLVAGAVGVGRPARLMRLGQAIANAAPWPVES